MVMIILSLITIVIKRLFTSSCWNCRLMARLIRIFIELFNVLAFGIFLHLAIYASSDIERCVDFLLVFFFTFSFNSLY